MCPHKLVPMVPSSMQYTQVGPVVGVHGVDLMGTIIYFKKKISTHADARELKCTHIYTLMYHFRSKRLLLIVYRTLSQLINIKMKKPCLWENLDITLSRFQNFIEWL